MLKLIDINKVYAAGDMQVQALKNVSLEFRESELVSILGPSGCGKTTMLNIIGGLDKYTSGDLIINGISTKEYKDSDWDAYRNSSIGFVFQSYNLISHLTVLENVELALTLSGVSVAERRQRAVKVLTEVGLESQIDKKPNQLSGGQMQRVAIARALVNNPDIVLADEPTGALDSVTSVQIMELLEEVAKTRLVIMVTHNSELAQKYSDRIIKLLDGEVISDTNPIDSPVVSENIDKKPKKTSMSFFTAFKLSLKNLFTKKVRTFITAFAGSIGIVGVALILALSSGFNAYIAKMQTDTLSSFPLTISSSAMDFSSLMSMMEMPDGEKYPEVNEIYINKVMEKMEQMYKTNNITDEYINEVVKSIDPELTYDISYSYGMDMNVYKEIKVGAISYKYQVGENWVQLVNNDDFINLQYDVLAGHLPTKYDELVLCVDQYNRLTDAELLQSLGIYVEDKESISFDDILNQEYKLLGNDVLYTKTGDTFKRKDDLRLSSNDYNGGETLKIVGIVRVNEKTVAGSIMGAIGYHGSLQQHIIEKEKASQIVLWQQNNPEVNCFTGNRFEDEITDPTVMGEAKKAEAEKRYKANIAKIGAAQTPVSINIYPKDFASKELIKQHLDDYNAGLDENSEKSPVYYSDMMGLMVESMNILVQAISYVLIAFTSISLVVSSIMIGVITYISVLERTKEIGILKSIGARKKDISRVFNAEALLIGFSAGALGVILTYILSIPLSLLLKSLTTIGGLVALNPLHALILILISMLLTFIAGLVPSGIAAKKDAVVALRSE